MCSGPVLNDELKGRVAPDVAGVEMSADHTASGVSATQEQFGRIAADWTGSESAVDDPVEMRHLQG